MLGGVTRLMLSHPSRVPPPPPHVNRPYSNSVVNRCEEIEGQDRSFSINDYYCTSH